jgi:hypothetical protein
MPPTFINIKTYTNGKQNTFIIINFFKTLNQIKCYKIKNEKINVRFKNQLTQNNTKYLK